MQIKRVKIRFGMFKLLDNFTRKSAPKVSLPDFREFNKRGEVRTCFWFGQPHFSRKVVTICQ